MGLEPDLDTLADRPWEHADEASWRIREAHVWNPRVAALNRLVEALRRETDGHVPWIDPFCGGVEAKLLLVFLRPGPRGAMASNFLSLGNTDATARNTVNVLNEAGISYRHLTFWNAIPWSGPREEKVTSAMLERGSDMFERLLPLLPNLKAVILVGGEAQRLEPYMPKDQGPRLLKCAHPGPFVWNQHRYRPLKEGIFDTFRIASAVVHNADGNEPSDVAGITAEITTRSGAT